MQASTVVGYAKSPNADAKSFSLVANMFVPVSGATCKLGDLTPVQSGTTPLTSANFNLSLLESSGGDNMLVADDETMATFCPEAAVEFADEYVTFCYDPDLKTWFLDADGEKYPMNDYPLPYGTGLLLFSTAKLKGGASLQCAGQVCTENTRASVDAKSFATSGNVAPKDMTLGDFSVEQGGTTPVTTANFNISLLEPTGGDNMLIDDDPVMETLFPEVFAAYQGEYVTFCYDTELAKWFLDADGETYCMNSYPIKAGQGFLLFATAKLKGGAKVVLPPAITTAK